MLARVSLCAFLWRALSLYRVINIDQWRDRTELAFNTNLLLHSIIITVLLPVGIDDVISECAAPRLTVIDTYIDKEKIESTSEILCLYQRLLIRAVLNWVSKRNLKFLWFCITTLCDWFIKFALHIQPIRCTCVFPRLAPVTCICFEFSLVHCVVFVCCDWPL